jgi:GNAT superfamily N-acetyltransferase
MTNDHSIIEVVANTVVPASIIPNGKSPDLAGEAKPDVTIEMAPASAAEDKDLVKTLTEIVNKVYGEFENGMYVDGFQRTTAPEVEKILAAGELGVAYLNAASPRRAVGCVRVQKLSETTGEFGMFAVDPKYQGGGLGRDMARFAEDRCRAQGLTVMRLELLFPTWFEHAFKVRLQGWYTRMGYSVVRLDDFHSEYPHLAKLLRGDCEFRVFEKSLVS